MRPRQEKMNPLEIEMHHIWSKCVQGQFMLGTDIQSGTDNSHRKQMLQALVESMLSVFAVECGTVNYLDNHFHGIWRNRPDIALQTGRRLRRE